MDVQSHVNNVQYLRFLEDARVQMLVHLGRPGQMMETGQVTVRHEIDYVAPLLFRVRRVLVDTWVERIGRTSYVLGYEIVDQDGTVFARARSVMVCIDPATGGKVPIEPGVRRGLKAYFDDGDVVDPTAEPAGLPGRQHTTPPSRQGTAADNGAVLARVGGDDRPDGAAS
jgi:acyl-CoA thioester hydrolase